VCGLHTHRTQRHGHPGIKAGDARYLFEALHIVDLYDSLAE
jgi:hypothetical protein